MIAKATVDINGPSFRIASAEFPRFREKGRGAEFVLGYCQSPLTPDPSPPKKRGRGEVHKHFFRPLAAAPAPLGRRGGEHKCDPAASAKKPRELRRLVAYATAPPKKYPRILLKTLFLKPLPLEDHAKH